MELTVVDDSDIVGWLAAATREDEVNMTDVKNMVENVLQRLIPYRRVCSPRDTTLLISRLNILDHGNANGIEMGSDWITLASVAEFEADLRRLNGHFTADGFVHLQHCNIGSNHALLTRLAGFFGVPVYAGTGKHNPVYRFNTGEYVQCEPSGTCWNDVSRP